MRLYIIRHGKAQADSPSGRDEDRPLRKRGARQIAWLAGQLEESGRPPSTILVSPLLRARETAQILSNELGVDTRLEPTLALGHPASDVVETLVEYLEARREESVAVVGHNPQLESLVAVLTRGLAAEPIRLRTGQCAVVDFRDGRPLVGSGELAELWRYDDE